MTLASTDSFLSLLPGCLVSLALGRASVRVVFFASICFTIFLKVRLYWRSTPLILSHGFDLLALHWMLDPASFACDRWDRFPLLWSRLLIWERWESTSVSSPLTLLPNSDCTFGFPCPVLPMGHVSGLQLLSICSLLRFNMVRHGEYGCLLGSFRVNGVAFTTSMRFFTSLQNARIPSSCFLSPRVSPQEITDRPWRSVDWRFLTGVRHVCCKWRKWVFRLMATPTQ